ncbi:hypothetical protein FA95DRAFT_1611228 [Auriscalpium vulgare]|uniref:Uncharacterized protein n=1 Tax=Auriscalpium vulgare TaxID=40419 RepID=A0ACB8RC69_9AGAM|nr:hypothetical protein FA95DRAFT_1611228 [Auriscalpium vulgare]
MRCVSVRCAEQHEPVVPTSRFQETELDKSVTEMQRILALTQHNLSLTHQPVHDTNAASNSLRVIGASELDPATFRRFWARRAPLVVRDVRLQGNWGPQFFQDRFNTTEATAVDCETEVVHKITLGNYFKDFAHGASSKVLKLKDFPPATHMKAALSDLNDAFLAAVPASDYTCPNGTRNLISHYHPQAISPDLGPKMYVAHATAQDDGHNGSTRLHVDVTCAVNIMLWASDLPDDVPGFALWHLFPPQTLAIVRAYIRTIVEDDEGDPIHNQTTYLTPSMLRTLQQDHGVSPVVVHQHVGEAVFIPANWAHQVSNAANAIKVACDFLSAENLLASVQVAKELRLQRLSAQYGDDVLQLNLSLWTAWSSLSELRTEILSRAALASSPTDGAGQGDTPNVMNDICGNLDNASDFLDLSADVQSAEAPSKGGGRKRRRKDAHSQDPIVGLPGDRFPCPVFECGRDSSRAGIMDHL